MRIKLDENIPRRLVEALTLLGHDVDTVEEERLTGSADPVVWAAAQREGRFLIPQDLDFSDVRRYQPGTHHGLLLVRLQAPGRNALIDGLCRRPSSARAHCNPAATLSPRPGHAPARRAAPRLRLPRWERVGERVKQLPGNSPSP